MLSIFTKTKYTYMYRDISMKHHGFCFVDEILAVSDGVVSLTEGLSSEGLKRWRNERKEERQGIM